MKAWDSLYGSLYSLSSHLLVTHIRFKVKAATYQVFWLHCEVLIKTVEPIRIVCYSCLYGRIKRNDERFLLGWISTELLHFRLWETNSGGQLFLRQNHGLELFVLNFKDLFQ